VIEARYHDSVNVLQALSSRCWRRRGWPCWSSLPKPKRRSGACVSDWPSPRAPRLRCAA